MKSSAAISDTGDFSATFSQMPNASPIFLFARSRLFYHWHQLIWAAFRSGNNGSELHFELTYAGPRPVRLTKIWAEVDAVLVNQQRWAIGSTGIQGHVHNSRVTDPVSGTAMWRRGLIANQSPPTHGGGVTFQPLHPILNSMIRPVILNQMSFHYLDFGANSNSLIRYGIETEEGPLGPYTIRISEIAVR